MGYYTRYYMSATDRSVTPHKELDQRFLGRLELGDFESDEDIWVSRQDGRYALYDEEGVKWYDYDGDMLRASRAHPNVLFVLDGVGEGPGDLWRSFYLAGVSYTWRPDVTPPEFDASMFTRGSVEVNG